MSSNTQLTVEENNENWEVINECLTTDFIYNQNPFSIKKSEEICFELDWSLRDELICLFNKLTSLAFAKKNSDLKALADKLDYLIISLTSLKNELLDQQQFCEATKLIGRKSQRKDYSNLKINSRIQLKLIKKLIDNKNLLILNQKLTNDEARDELIRENNSLVHELMSLEMKPVDNQISADNEVGETKLYQNEPKDEKEKFNEQLMELKMNNLHLSKENANLKEKLKLLENGQTTNEWEFNFVLNNFTEFSKTIGESRRSPLFDCGNLKWYLNFKIYEEKGKKYLSYFLLPYGTHLGTQVEFTFAILNQEDASKNLKKTYNNWFKSMGYGLLKFVDFDTLFDPNSRFVKDDQVIAKISLKIVKTLQITGPLPDKPL